MCVCVGVYVCACVAVCVCGWVGEGSRSSMCKVIAANAKDPFVLMDALQEPILCEVHQHLEAINAPNHKAAHQMWHYNAIMCARLSL